MSGTGQQETHTRLRQSDALVQKRIHHHPVQAAVAQAPQNFLPLLRHLPIRKIPHPQAALLAQQTGHRLNLAHFIRRDRIGGPSVATLKNRLARRFGQRTDQLVEGLQLVDCPRQQPRP